VPKSFPMPRLRTRPPYSQPETSSEEVLTLYLLPPLPPGCHSP
jgi:hypothetical protein